MEWMLSVACCVLSAATFLMVPLRTFGYSSVTSSSRLLSSYPNDSSSSSSLRTRSQITISLLKSRKHSLKKDLWRLENEISTPYPLTEDAAEGYYNNNSELGGLYATQTDSWNGESCWLGISCEEFSSVAPPHDVINLVPPPPLPLFLFFQLELLSDTTNLEEYLFLMDQFDFQSYYLVEKKNDEGTKEEKEIFRVNPLWVSKDVAYGCSLCKWATSNFTDLFFIAHSPYEGTEGKWKWIEMLVVVGFASGIFGAVLACFLTRFKCRVFGQKESEKESSVPDFTSATQTVCDSERLDQKTLTTKDTLQGKAAGNFSQGDFLEASSTDSEDTYINGSSINLRFSKLVSKDGEVEGDSVFYYDPATLSNGTGLEYGRRNDFNGINIENNQEIHCEVSDSSIPTVSPVRSPFVGSSTPSSAYYSDLSVFELPSIKKKKMKRKGDLERKIKRGLNHLLDNRSPYLANHLFNTNPSSLPFSNDFRTQLSQVQNTNDNLQQHFPCLNIPQNTSHIKRKCLHNSPNFIQNRTRISDMKIDVPQPVPTTILTSKVPITTHVAPNCLHLTPECMRYKPNVILKNTNLQNVNNFQNPYIVGEETVPALIKHFDKGSEMECINNNITTDNMQKFVNISKLLERTEKVKCHCLQNSLNNNVSSLETGEKNVFQEHALNSSSSLNEFYREQDIYRVYSSSEVPSEYI